MEHEEIDINTLSNDCFISIRDNQYSTYPRIMEYIHEIKGLDRQFCDTLFDCDLNFKQASASLKLTRKFYIHNLQRIFKPLAISMGVIKREENVYGE